MSDTGIVMSKIGPRIPGLPWKDYHEIHGTMVGDYSDKRMLADFLQDLHVKDRYASEKDYNSK